MIHRHDPTIRAARRLWPHAEWIIGTGRFASVAHCSVTTVMLFGTRAEAEIAKRLIDSDACGHACHNDHELIEISA